MTFSETIRAKVEEIENRDWEFKMKKYKDDLNAESKRIESFRQIAITYFQNQPRTIIYNHIIW